MVSARVVARATARPVCDALSFAMQAHGGACSAVEGARWTDDWSSYVAEANENLVMVPLIETVSGVENFEEIVSSEGVDFVLIGFGDLAQHFGTDQVRGREQLVATWEECLTTGHRHGVKVGCNFAPRYPHADFYTINGDLKSLMRAARQQLLDVRGLVDGE